MNLADATHAFIASGESGKGELSAFEAGFVAAATPPSDWAPEVAQAYALIVERLRLRDTPHDATWSALSVVQTALRGMGYPPVLLLGAADAPEQESWNKIHAWLDPREMDGGHMRLTGRANHTKISLRDTAERTPALYATTRFGLPRAEALAKAAEWCEADK